MNVFGGLVSYVCCGCARTGRRLRRAIVAALWHGLVLADLQHRSNTQVVMVCRRC